MIIFFLKSCLLSVSILIFVVPAYSNDYRVAIFDYDRRPEKKISIAKYIELRLTQSELTFAEILQATGEEDDETALSVLTDLDSANYDLIITITSDAMLPALHSIKKTPWLFTNVNNPKFLGINDETQHSRNVSGVTYYIPAIRQLEFFREVMGGKLKKVGFIFDYYAKSRRAELGEFRFAAMELGIAHEIFLIRNVHDLPGAAKKLMDMEAEAVILTSSDTIYNHTASIVEICNTRNIPVFSVNREGVVHGAIAALASDYYLMVDKCLLPMAISVLKKVTQPAEMPIRSIQSPSVYLNIKQAEKLGIKIPENIRAMPSLVF